jgi:AraC family transcriptional regulator
MAAISVADGTLSSAHLSVGRFGVSEVAFAGERRLRRHAHPRGCVAVIVDGAVEKRFGRRCSDAVPGTVVTMPPEEPHEDRFGRDGARIVVVEADDGVEAVSSFRDWHATLLSLQIARELARPDAFTPLAVEGLALELFAAAARGPAPVRAEPWLETARDLLHERFLDPPSAGAIAGQVGVHPAHLARAFRARYGDSLGGYARRLRLEWAAEQLVRTDVPLAWLACQAGFVDQSHFTRAFRRRFGVAPGRYRAAHR